MKPLCAVFAFCLIICVSAFPQDRGTIVCDPGSTLPVPAWTSPGGTGVVEQLSCGQTVSILDLERGYFEIQLGDRLGYVYAKYVSVAQTQQQTMPQPIAVTTQVQQPAPSAIIAEKPTKPSGAYRGEPRRHEGGLYFDASHMYYGEADFMRNKGYFWGVSGDYTYLPNKFMLQVDGRFGVGSVDYWAIDTSTSEGMRDYNFETRFSFGYDLAASDKASFIPFIGLGYRYLFDGESGAIAITTGKIDYDRKANYLYSPIGMETKFRLGAGWSLGISGEYDLFWHGWQYSQFDEIDPYSFTAKNDQMNGWGARGSVALIKSFGKTDFAIEPHFRYWDIEESDITPLLSCPPFEGCYVGVAAEPQNSTMEWGARVGIRF